MREDEGRIIRHNHTVSIEGREKVSITGVEDMDSFNEEEVTLVTEYGYLSIGGHDLHISKLNLDEGQLVLEGYIEGLEYADADISSVKGGLFSRLFR